MFRLSTIRIGSRPSRLALKQVEEVIWMLDTHNIKFEIVTFDTTGDIDKYTPISEIEGTDFFTDTIEKALLKKEIDLAVHSAKDLPDIIHPQLEIVAITESLDPYDALVVRKDLNYKSLDDLPYGAKIATSSKRRKEQLKNYRQDFEIFDIRGNIEERIEILDRSSFDATVLASCGLIRLGLQNRITQKIPFEILRPHPLQGCLAVEIRKDSFELKEIFKLINQKFYKGGTN
ncbi:MAG: hydroxymethylbilane synthase [Candidatus Omnitrophica bacterium]|nr:hydroxymethylbilane synthase [Candidatus Omnitrophota bacterium]